MQRNSSVFNKAKMITYFLFRVCAEVLHCLYEYIDNIYIMSETVWTHKQKHKSQQLQ